MNHPTRSASGIGGMVSSMPAAATSKEQLAAEIAKIEAELERKRLEEEIRRMQAQIEQQQRQSMRSSTAKVATPAHAQAVSTPQTPSYYPSQTPPPPQAQQPPEQPTKRIVKRLVRKTRSRPKQRESLKPADATEDAKATCTVAEMQRKKLEDEIRQMEEAIAAERERKQTMSIRQATAAVSRPAPTPPVARQSAPPPRQQEPQISLTPQEKEAVGRFQKMVKLGLPEGAVQHRMEMEKLASPHMIQAVFGGGSSTTNTNARSVPPPPAPKPQLSAADLQRQQLEAEIAAMEAAIAAQATKKSQNSHVTAPAVALSPEDEATADRFRKMVKMGLPEGAVRHRMALEKVSPTIVEAVLGPDQDKASSKPTTPYRASTPNKPQLTPAELQRQQLEAEIAAMEAAIAQQSRGASSSSSSAVPAAPVRPNMAGLLAAVTQAATERESRIEDNNGELFMQDFEPEVAAQKQSTPQLSFSMAEMVSKMALEREKRLEDGGEKRMTKVKEKEEYKKDFNSIVREAAQMGKLTRLNEHVVEAVAAEKTAEQEWKSNGLLAISWRSNHMSVIHEAARAGAAIKLPEKIVSNCPEEEQDWDYSGEEKPMSDRMKQLLKLNQEPGAGQHKVDKLILGRKELNDPRADSMIVRPMIAYSNIEDVQLPKATAPKIDVKAAQERVAKRLQQAAAEHRPMADIGNEVATRAWERRARLDRPNVLPRIKEVCPCPYCETASPFQTYAYKVREQQIKEGKLDPASLQNHQPSHGHESFRAERERKRLERLRRHNQLNAVEEETVGMEAARSKFGQSVSAQRETSAAAVAAAVATATPVVPQQCVEISNMPTDLGSSPAPISGGTSVVDDASSIYSGAVSVEGSIVSTASRPRSGRVVRKVRKVRKKRPVSGDSGATSSTQSSVVSNQGLAPVVEIESIPAQVEERPSSRSDDASIVSSLSRRLVRKRRPKAVSQKQPSAKPKATRPAVAKSAPAKALSTRAPVATKTTSTPSTATSSVPAADQKAKGLLGGLFGGKKKAGGAASAAAAVSVPSQRTRSRVSRKK